MKGSLIVTILGVWISTKGQQTFYAFSLHVENCKVKRSAFEFIPEIIVESKLELVEILQ
jgi:hypothetical protein